MAHVLLGVSAGIAIYKSADLASRLTQRGDMVRTLMTPNALRFVTPLTFQAVTRQPVYTDIFEDPPGSSLGDGSLGDGSLGDTTRDTAETAGSMEHISLSDWADVLLIAPATADLLGRLAAGLGDNMLTATALAFPKAVVCAPAMNDQMWANPIVQSNIERLAKVAGYRFVDPESGHLACGSVGQGRLAAAEVIIEALDEALQQGREERPEG